AMGAGGSAALLNALHILEHEIKTTMALAGVARLEDLNPDLVERAGALRPAHVLSAFPLLEEGY
ncbi:MAG: alpha-hydroxy-acid oxidizing protein, partial [Pseudomonadota bacterium]